MQGIQVTVPMVARVSKDTREKTRCRRLKQTSDIFGINIGTLDEQVSTTLVKTPRRHFSFQTTRQLGSARPHKRKLMTSPIGPGREQVSKFLMSCRCPHLDPYTDADEQLRGRTVGREAL